MSQDLFADNLVVAPLKEDPAFDQYHLPEGDAVEKAQTATHLYRAKEASLLELRRQIVEKIAEYEFALSRIDAQLG